MKEEKTTMAEIAGALGVSKITVSRALSGQEGVSDSLREKILEKARQTGYLRAHPNSAPRVLVLHQKPILHDSSNYSHKIQGLETALQEAGCEYDFEFVDKPRQEAMGLPSRAEKGVYDGVIFIGGFSAGYVRRITERIRNFVVYTGYAPSDRGDCVWYDFIGCGYRQCDYLIGRGHREIAYIGGESALVNGEKLIGIRDALKAHGLPERPELFLCGSEAFEEPVARLLRGENPPTAFICQWDYTAIRLLQFLHDRGVRVPEDVSVIGTGNTEMSSLSIPALTTMELWLDYACSSAVSLLLRRIALPGKPDESVRIGCTLIERGSVRTLPAPG